MLAQGQIVDVTLLQFSCKLVIISEMRKCFLYVLEFPNEWRYYGISYRPIDRLQKHIRAARAGSMNPVHCAIRKYQKIVIEVVAEGSVEEMRMAEIHAIATEKNLYNVSLGGDISPMLVEETRRKVSVSMKRRYEDPAHREQNRQAQKLAQNRPDTLEKRKPYREMYAAIALKMGELNKGRKWTDAQMAKHLERITGRKNTPETIEKMRAAALLREERYRKQGATPNTGRKHTDEAKANMSAACIERERRKRENLK